MTPRKTAQEISDAIVTQMMTSLETTIPLLPKTFTRVLAKVLGMVFVSLYAFAGWILMQMFVRYASNEPIKVGSTTITPLQEWGRLVGKTQSPGTRAELTVVVTVNTQGGTLYSGERISNPANQMIYTVIGSVPLNADTVFAQIRATKASIAGNVDVGTTLQFVKAPSGVDKDVGVWQVNTPGVEPTTTEEYREEILEWFMARPQGGAMQDYRDWAEEVDDVKNAYPYSGWDNAQIPGTTGAGQVFVYIESKTATDGIPNSTLLDAVKDHIEHDESGLAARRGINTYVYCLAITRKSFDVLISGLVAKNIDAVKAEIETAISEYMLGREPGGQSGYTVLPPKRDIVQRGDITGIASRIAAKYNGWISDAYLILNGSNISNSYLQEGEKAKLGTLSWS